MKIVETNIEDLLIIEPTVFKDSRGYFFESYNKEAFKSAGIDYNFVQDNQSQSSFGVIRGLHMQKDPYSQTKLIRVLEGRIYDIAVDLRPDSKTFAKWFGIELSAQNQQQLLIPKGFFHGFSVLSKSATIFYKCDEVYHPNAETGIRYNDPDLNINWQLPEQSISVSEKDLNQPFLKDIIPQ